MLITIASVAVLALGVAATTPDTLRRPVRCRGTGCPRNEVPNRIAVTPQHRATAFLDSSARTLLLRAREARLQRDSAILSYDAMAYQRLSVGMKVGPVARNRVLFRTEHASRVRWHRDIGARVEVVGARKIQPGLSRDKANQGMRDGVSDMTMLPYHPGQETLWIENGLELTEGQLVHPIAEGAEAHYTYESGDVVGLRLPDGTGIRLRELKVRPRIVRWNLVVGSLWFDADRGQLVRAAYRLAEPIEVWAEVGDDPADDGDDVPLAVRSLVRPLRAQVSAMVVEYGLHRGRFWLPRLQSLEGHAQASFARVSFSTEQSYRYSAVNAPALDSLAPIALPPHLQALVALDSLPEAERDQLRDSMLAARRVANRARSDSVAKGLLKQLSPCDTGTTYTTTRTRTQARIPVLTTISCDHRALANSSELPGSIYSDKEDLFDEAARDALVAGALALGVQPKWGPRPPVLEFGLPLTRFNRVEGLSLGVRSTQQLGAGYVADGTLRFGLADREPNLELGLARTNLARTVRIGAYSRLLSANDWGNPLSFGSSLSALLWGRDDGFYYRASGVDLAGTRERGAHFAWQLFAEQQRPAAAENSFSFAKLARDVEFQSNIVAERGLWAGGSLRAVRTLGLDPRDWRALGDARLEVAGGKTAYSRAALDVTLSRALGPATRAVPLAALTLSAGSSVGDVPPQRLWFLGGTHTVRGQPAGAASGDAYWFGRFELAQDLFRVGRLSLFGDVGWAGPRSAFPDQATFRLRAPDGERRPLSGVGVGYSLLDGLLRLDVAKGMHPVKGWRPDLYFEARF